MDTIDNGPVCLCGCGHPCRVAFVRGHDAIYKSQAISIAVNPKIKTRKESKHFTPKYHYLWVAPSLEELVNEDQVGELSDDEMKARARQVHSLLISRGMGPLGEKVVEGVDNWIAKRDRAVTLREAQAKMKRDKSKPGEWVEGKTRVGRWAYEARKNTKSGTVEYINARGERNVATAGTPGAANFRSYAQIEAEQEQVS